MRYSASPYCTLLCLWAPHPSACSQCLVSYASLQHPTLRLSLTSNAYTVGLRHPRAFGLPNSHHNLMSCLCLSRLPFRPSTPKIPAVQASRIRCFWVTVDSYEAYYLHSLNDWMRGCREVVVDRNEKEMTGPRSGESDQRVPSRSREARRD